MSDASNNEFRDAIGEALCTVPSGEHCHDAAQAVLNMPQMQAIKAALYSHARTECLKLHGQYQRPLMIAMLQSAGLPDDVIAWVLS